MNLDASIAIRLQPRFVTFVFAVILLPNCHRSSQVWPTVDENIAGVIAGVPSDRHKYCPV